ncbi:CocE/NonD family hydrolase C-terminal non-catalytic domain-containing protein [Actinoalloteichus spitiensis]|uniref:CocE/NonD family hydrolase C-terminal non-catalytic domain-containing protein n=1 Tax=Actinoalloteichus spitiensis TaxID=252394 RepID=UPI0024798674|nr:CocE/NonD family hydrolase C-terminal non-catalytic domain-containing protein [Actinoalloteichus spitiensis]
MNAPIERLAGERNPVPPKRTQQRPPSPWDRTGVRNRHSPYRQRDMIPDHEYVFRWNVDATDRVLPRGHRIGVVLISTDPEHTLRYPAGTRSR